MHHSLDEVAKYEQQWNEMTITSDPMFGMVIENKEICIQLIQRALPHLQLKEIVNIETQKDVGNVAAKKVRYDVYVLDKR